MEFDLFSCTFENLNNLKFNELQKLSARFHVTKRWAKKREIIDKLLSLRDQKLEKNQPHADPEKTELLQENIDWVDGGKAFVTKGVDNNQGFESVDNERRLTYCINKPDPETTERRLTYKIEKGEHLICDATDYNNFDRRLTYNLNDKKCHNVNLKAFASENYGTIKEKVNMNHNKLATELKPESNIINSQAPSKESKDSTSSKVKMLTVPYTRLSSHNNSRIKIKDLKYNAGKQLENPSYIRKSVGRVSENFNSAQIVQQENSDSMRHNNVLKSSGIEKNISKIPGKSSVNCNRDIKNETVKQNISRSALPRRKSKTEDNVLVRNFKPSKNLMFYSPKESGMKNISFSKPSSALDLELTCRSRIPKAKPAVSSHKPIVANKMPDFSKIHQRRFEQMDSLIDYVRKKEERTKKLFGLPQPGIPLKGNRNDVPKVFQFKSSNTEKENKLIKPSDSLKKDIQKNIKGIKEKSNRKDILSRAGSKPDIMMNLKEQNRKHLHGVRTNKRFELQMKSRKL